MIILTHSEIDLPKIIDLFSGCGGLAYGFKSEGFSIASGIELSKSAVETASYNLYWVDGLESEHECGDITEADITQVIKGNNESNYIVVGGPPCQAYSKAGRAKLRSLGEHRIHTSDSRGYLYQDFLRFVIGLNASIVVMENVPESTDFGGVNIPQIVCDILEENGYDAHWTVLNAADYGVPQIRERVILLGSRRELGLHLEFPRPTHRSADGKIPPRQMRIPFYSQFKNYKYPPNTSTELPNWITVGEAISDLPVLFESSKSKFKSHKLNIALPYRSEIQNKYQELMRQWSGFEEKKVTANSFRKTLRDFPIFEEMKEGDDYRDACIIADRQLEEACRLLNINRLYDQTGYADLRRKLVPPYDREKFHSKWKKLNSELPSHTIVAHLDTDTYSHIHPWEPRGISVREAARLQSFPDNFLFQGSMGDAFRQIGNAVPPLLAKAIARTIKNSLGEN